MKAFPQAAISLMSHVDSNLLNSCNTLPDLCKCRNANPLVLFVTLARYQILWSHVNLMQRMCLEEWLVKQLLLVTANSIHLGL